MLKKLEHRAKELLEAVEHNVILNGTEVLPYTLQKRLEALQHLKSYEGKVEMRESKLRWRKSWGLACEVCIVILKNIEKMGWRV